MTPEQELLRNAYLAEMWPTCRELSFGERAAKRREDRKVQVDRRLLSCTVDTQDPVGE